jgi:hypothetical protein
MEHFSQIYDLCRASLAGDAKAGRAAARALHKTLAAAGDTDDAQLLHRLIKAFTQKKQSPALNFVPSSTAPCPHCNGQAVTEREVEQPLKTRYGTGLYTSFISTCGACRTVFVTPEQADRTDHLVRELRVSLRTQIAPPVGI